VPRRFLSQVRSWSSQGGRINISEAAIRSGAVQHIFPATFPSGQGSDLAGVWPNLVWGDRFRGRRRGDRVLRPALQPRRIRDRPATQLTLKPVEVSWEVAGSLYVAGAPPMQRCGR